MVRFRRTAAAEVSVLTKGLDPKLSSLSERVPGSKRSWSTTTRPIAAKREENRRHDWPATWSRRDATGSSGRR